MVGGNLRSHSLASPRRRLGVRGVLEPGPGSSSLERQGGAPGPRLTHNPPTRGGSLWGHSTRIRHQFGLGWVLPMASNLTKSTLLYLTLPATVARGYLRPAPPVTRSTDLLQLGRSASARHGARAPGSLASPCRGAHWLGQQDSAPSPAPPAAPPPPPGFPPQPGRESCCNKQAVHSLASSGQMK